MPSIDRSAIATLAEIGGTSPGMSLLEEVLESYFDSSPSLVERMRASAMQGDLKGMKAAAHSLKSSSALVGATEFAETCGSIEAASAEAQVHDLVSSAVSQFEVVVSDLRIILEEAKAVKR